MSARAMMAAGVLTATLILSAADAQEVRALRVHKPTAPASLAGLWETEIARGLISGEIEKGLAAPTPGGPDPLDLEVFRRMKLWGSPPYNAQWEQKSRVEPPRAATSEPTHLTTFCGMTHSFPFFMEELSPAGFQFVVTPEETLILDIYGVVRHIYTDGRTHPRDEDLWQTALGDSIGRWQRGTLLIDTIARKAGPVVSIPMPGIADLSDQAHFTESLRLLNANTLQDDMTIDDPERFTHPWQISIRYKRVTDVDRLRPVDCTENERNTIINRKETIAPP